MKTCCIPCVPPRPACWAAPSGFQEGRPSEHACKLTPRTRALHSINQSSNQKSKSFINRANLKQSSKIKIRNHEIDHQKSINQHSTSKSNSKSKVRNQSIIKKQNLPNQSIYQTSSINQKQSILKIS